MCNIQAWAGIGSDISYYLNSHHIDFHVWSMQGKGRCVSVSAVASEGVVAAKMLGRPCEDTITLTAEWENLLQTGQSSSKGLAIIYMPHLKPNFNIRFLFSKLYVLALF